jgi:hypothetical protein
MPPEDVKFFSRLKVVAHCAAHLRFPAQWLRTRRDNERFLSLLEIVTFVHQCHRADQNQPVVGRSKPATL